MAADKVQAGHPEAIWRLSELPLACVVLLAGSSLWWLATPGPDRSVDYRIDDGHPVGRWSNDTRKSYFLATPQQDIDVKSPNGGTWRGTLVSGALLWPNSSWQARFSVLPALVRPDETEAMKDVLKDAFDEFDEDRDGVDLMITYEFIIASAGAVKATDPPREGLRQRLLAITEPIIRSRIGPFVQKRYPAARAVCHSMIRRYLHGERRTHGTHWDIPSYVSVIVSLDSHGNEFDGGFYVTTGTGLQSFIPLQRGDTVVHQGDLLHGVHVRSGDRWSWAMWFQDTADCSSDPADWWKEKARHGNPVAQTLSAMRSQTHEEALSWVRAAAKTGFPRAMLYRGKSYEEGWKGERRDLQQAALWYEKARRAGDVDAFYYLGAVERTLGNATGAAVFFKEGAELGDPQAMEELGGVYLNGTGLPRDLDLATRWYQQAADFRLESMYQTFLLYMQPTESRRADTALADLYLERAARMGHVGATEEFLRRLVQQKRWEEAVPWLLRMERQPFMEMFVKLYKSNIRMKPFTVLRAELILRGYADAGNAEAGRLLSTLRDAATRAGEL